jgi:DNA repair protein SbcC/Rad50
MNPLRLRLRNLRTYDELDFEIPEGLTVIAGENGVGKSTLATAIDWALFGPDARSWSPYLTQGAESTELMVELTFDHGDDTYRIRRGYSARGTGKATLDFERQDSPGIVPATKEWLPLTAETTKATQELLEQTLGLTRDTFRASSMLVQGDGAAFAEAQPKDRKQILADVLGLAVWDRLLEVCRLDLSALRKEMAVREARGELLVGEVETKRDVERALMVSGDILKEAREAEDKAAAEIEKLDEQVRGWAQAGAAQAAARARYAQLTADLRTMDDRLEKGRQARVALRAAKDELGKPGPRVEDLSATVDALAAERRGHDEAVAVHARGAQVRQTILERRDRHLAEADRLSAEAGKLIDELNAILAGDTAACPVCHQPLGDAARDASVATMRERWTALDDAARKAHGEAAEIDVPPDPAAAPALRAGWEQAFDQAKVELAAANASATERARLEARVALLAEELAGAPSDDSVEQLRRDWTELDEQVTALPALPTDEEMAAFQDRLGRLNGSREEERIRGTVASVDHTKAQAALDRIVALEEELAALVAQRNADAVELGRLETLERAYGRDGIPAMIVENVAIPSIERDANRILDDLGAGVRLELRTERALQSGGLKDALDVIVQTDTGDRPYETFSGGERTRINLALRIGLARLMAHRRGSESRMLVIDEPEYLDENGTAALLGVLRGLVADFDRVWLISHVSELRTAAVDQTIVISKNDAGLSTLAG